MRAILISDHAIWCAKMMNGDKTIEVRKGTALYKATQKLIDEYGFAEFYVYCTKGKEILGRILNIWTTFKPTKWVKRTYNGKVIFKFRCYKVEEIKQNIGVFWRYGGHPYYTNNLDEYELLNRSCLSITELENYLKGKTGCAIHISDLEIFDKPKELSEFMAISKKTLPPKNRYILTKAPQSFCYIEEDFE